ncbi:MAG: potassium transporter TrkH [Kiritimatiellae bacterium]|nr:potassium transporter TrkH [Kiritimatiellia bacterium]
MRVRASFALGFLALILVGAALLACPFARADGAGGSFGTALFTACSAVCVTGLTVVDVAREYSVAGQVVLMVLVELGCLGLMTCGTFFLIAIGRRLSLAREFTLMNAYGVAQIKGLRGLICWVVGSMLVIEGAFAAALYLHFGDWYEAVFYSIMSFCNAGFGLKADSLASFPRGWPVVLMGVETILGGIGFLVIYNLCTFKFAHRASGARGRLSLHTRVVLRFTFYLLALAFLVFLAVEWRLSLAGMDLADKAVVAFYQAVTPRTCGFTVVPTASLHPFTRLLYECLMFVGGAPGSAAAGMKVTTLAVILYTTTAMCRGEAETVIACRAIPTEIVREALVILMAIVMFAVLVAGALFLTESGGAVASDALVFEAVSAVTTTGLSVGDTTASLSTAGRAVVMVAMFIGRLGALTVVLMIGDRESKKHVRYPLEELVVG